MIVQSFTINYTDAASATVSAEVLDRGPSMAVAGVSPVQAKQTAIRIASAVRAASHAWPGAVRAHVEMLPRTRGVEALDLAIAVSILGVDRMCAGGVLVCGELGLDGSVRRVPGVFAAAQLARSLGCWGIVVPLENAREALDALTPDDGVKVHTIGHLSEVRTCLDRWESHHFTRAKSRAPHVVDFAEVRGHGDAIATIERAVTAHMRGAGAGKASPGLLLEGTPGTGKTMLARRIPTIMPTPSRGAREHITRTYSALGLCDALVEQRPFRAPHHTISAMALGTNVAGIRRPGEAQLAAYGVLMLDEIEEFRADALDNLRHAIAELPADARPLLVATANPCPCGYHGSQARQCVCTPAALARHAERVTKACASLGITERVRVDYMPLADMRAAPEGPPSEEIRERITLAIGGAS